MNVSLTASYAPAGAAPPMFGLRLRGIDEPADGSAGLAERPRSIDSPAMIILISSPDSVSYSSSARASVYSSERCSVSTDLARS